MNSNPEGFIAKQNPTPEGISMISKSNLSVYPNPSNGLVNVKLDDNSDEICRLEIISVTGGVKSVKTNQDTQTVVDLSGYPNGIFIIKVTTLKGEVYTSRVQKLR